MECHSPCLSLPDVERRADHLGRDSLVVPAGRRAVADERGRIRRKPSANGVVEMDFGARSAFGILLVNGADRTLAVDASHAGKDRDRVRESVHSGPRDLYRLAFEDADPHLSVARPITSSRHDVLR